MGEAAYYGRDVIDARFEGLRHELRADIANLRTELKVDIADVKASVGELRAQMRVWGLALAVAIPVLTQILTKVWK